MLPLLINLFSSSMKYISYVMNTVRKLGIVDIVYVYNSFLMEQQNCSQD